MAEARQYQYGFLPEQAQEDALHSVRLLAVEERPFTRVTKSLLSEESLLRPQRAQLPTPPPDGEASWETAADDNTAAQVADLASRRAKFREEVLLDFQALENSIVRIQLTLSSNARERERYAAQKAEIIATAQNVRENTVALRSQLAEAQKVLELRTGYDKLAERILEDKKLKSRDEAQREIEALEKEMEDLQQEIEDADGVWQGRKEQFERVVAEGEAMRRLIKGIKDEPEVTEEDKTDETMGDGDVDDEGRIASKDDLSRVGTPRLDAATPRDVVETPMPVSLEDAGGATPRPVNKFLEVEDATRTSSRVASPRMQPQDATNDVDMAEEIQMTSDEQVKASTGLEATDDQVKTPGETAEEVMDET